MNKDYIDALWHESELASVNSDLEIHQIFYKLIVKECIDICDRIVSENFYNDEKSAGALYCSEAIQANFEN